MKTNTFKNIVLFIIIVCGIIFLGFNAYGQTTLYAKSENLNNLRTEQMSVKSPDDSEKTRYYEAPFNDLPFGVFNIIDTAYLIVYSQEKVHRRYGSYLKYYYSLNIKSRVHELVLENLQVDFSDNVKFLKSAEKNMSQLHQVVNGITILNKILIESFDK